jgi:hypothetical protein
MVPKTVKESNGKANQNREILISFNKTYVRSSDYPHKTLQNIKPNQNEANCILTSKLHYLKRRKADFDWKTKKEVIQTISKNIRSKDLRFATKPFS